LVLEVRTIEMRPRHLSLTLSLDKEREQNRAIAAQRQVA